MTRMKYTIKLLIALTGFVLAFGTGFAQNFSPLYPIGDDPDIKYVSSYTSQEKILFEANPTVRYSFYSTFSRYLACEDRIHSQALYLAARPQLRMYQEVSKPVKTPSYRVFLGTQQLFRLNQGMNNKVVQFVGFSFESGHYSNGQSGCAFCEDYQDQTEECDSIYATFDDNTDLSALLNRKNGNFSTNMSELLLNYQWHKLDSTFSPVYSHSVELGYTLYHDRFLGVFDFGGYSDNDIGIYGRHRLMLNYELTYKRQRKYAPTFAFRQNIEYILDHHVQVNPIRLVSTVTFYPIPAWRTFGVFTSYIYGHDNYNFRLVDSGHQFAVGLSWDQFAPAKLGGKRCKK
ncbi:hypothetical protein KFE98_02840 [bacterium SCSIO 12741]|nr:hypothetical protein KFE98_02840 [bacterium SCSIO 12741]